MVKYRLLGPRVDLFTVDPNTGKTVSLGDIRRNLGLLSRTVCLCLHVGSLLVRQGAKLDREAFQDPRVELILVGEDIGGLNSSVPLTITILDQNDNPPVFSPSSFSVRLPENSPTGTLYCV